MTKISRILSIDQAQNSFSAAIKSLRHAPVLLTEHGERIAVLLPPPTYNKLISTCAALYKHVLWNIVDVALINFPAPSKDKRRELCLKAITAYAMIAHAWKQNLPPAQFHAAFDHALNNPDNIPNYFDETLAQAPPICPSSRVPILTAATDLRSLAARAAVEPVAITRADIPQAVLMSAPRYDALLFEPDDDYPTLLWNTIAKDPKAFLHAPRRLQVDLSLALYATFALLFDCRRNQVSTDDFRFLLDKMRAKADGSRHYLSSRSLDPSQRLQ